MFVTMCEVETPIGGDASVVAPIEESVENVSGRLSLLEISPRRSSRLRPPWTRFVKPKGWLEGMPRVGFVYDETMLEHKLIGHVERPGRLSVPYQRLNREGTLQRCFQLESRRAAFSEICLFHTPEHVSNVQNGNIDENEDLYWLEGATIKSAIYSTGCTLQAVESVIHGVLNNGFALVRPPGHHAEQCAGEGFCFFNNVAIAALKALSFESLCKRVLILDWDVHHGNGTQNCFYKDSRVLYISLHRGGDFYPGTGEITETGEGDGFGYNVNIPWPRGGFGDSDYLLAFECIIEPVIEAFQPDLTIVSAGFDAVVHDPLGGLSVTPACFAHLTEKLLKLNPKTVLVLEGGYNLLQLASCVDLCMRVLLGDEPKQLNKRMKLQPETEQILLEVAESLFPVWPILARDTVQQKIQQFRSRY